MKRTSLPWLLLGILGPALQAAPPLKVLVVGDSITHHSPAVEKLGWKSNWGMAASSESRDYVHRFVHQLEEQTGAAPSLAIEAEGGGTLAGKMAALDRIAADQADVAVIQMGENDKVVTDAAFLQPYERILAAVRRGNPRARIFCFGVWSPPAPATQADLDAKKADASKDAMIRALCAQNGATFVDLSLANANAANQAKAENRFTNAGVNWHPGDRGMAAYAAALWSAYVATSP